MNAPNGWSPFDVVADASAAAGVAGPLNGAARATQPQIPTRGFGALPPAGRLLDQRVPYLVARPQGQIRGTGESSQLLQFGILGDVIVDTYDSKLYTTLGGKIVVPTPKNQGFCTLKPTQAFADIFKPNTTGKKSANGEYMVANYGLIITRQFLDAGLSKQKIRVYAYTEKNGDKIDKVYDVTGLFVLSCS